MEDVHNQPMLRAQGVQSSLTGSFWTHFFHVHVQIWWNVYLTSHQISTSMRKQEAILHVSDVRHVLERRPLRAIYMTQYSTHNSDTDGKQLHYIHIARGPKKYNPHYCNNFMKVVLKSTEASEATLILWGTSFEAIRINNVCKHLLAP